MRTVLVYLLALGAVAAAALFAFDDLLGAETENAEAGPARRGAPVPVVVAVATRAPFVDALDALGTVKANESVEITPNRADHLAAVHFDDGQAVDAGQLLVEMHKEEETARLAEAAALRDEARMRLKQELELFDEDMASQRTLDNARAVLDAAEARVLALQAAIADREVRAPFAGTLGLRRVSEGAYVDPSTVITTLDDLSTVKLDFTIPETWLGAVRPGMAITARSDAWPGTTFSGEVATVDTRLDARTRSATVRALLPNEERLLRPGMLLKVTIARGEQPTLQIPEEAVVPVGDSHHVRAVDDGDVVRHVPVEVGRRRVGTVEILSGLDEGDRVVVESVDRVRPGARVVVIETRGAGGEGPR